MGWINSGFAIVKLSVVAVASYFAANSVAQLPIIEQNWTYFGVEATSLDGLQAQLRARGPNGFFAFTRWNVTWSPGCKVWVSVSYEFPRHDAPESLPNQVRVKWQSMLRALRDHEEQHGRNGINAGLEIMQANCENPQEILFKWNEADRLFDQRTEHGKNQGATLAATLAATPGATLAATLGG